MKSFSSGTLRTRSRCAACASHPSGSERLTVSTSELNVSEIIILKWDKTNTPSDNALPCGALHYAHCTIGGDVDGREDRPREGQIGGPGTKQKRACFDFHSTFQDQNDRCVMTLANFASPFRFKTTKWSFRDHVTKTGSGYTSEKQCTDLPT